MMDNWLPSTSVMVSPSFRCPSQKPQGVSWTHLFLSYIHRIAPFLQNIFWLEPLITLLLPYCLGSSQHLRLQCTVFLNELCFHPCPLFKTNLNIKLKSILLKSKCVVKLTLPKERSVLCLGCSEVMCHIWQKCTCLGQGLWVTQYQ